MAGKPWDRLRSRRKDHDGDDKAASGTGTGDADLGSEEHAWWARDDKVVSEVPHGRRSRPDPDEPKRSAFEDYYSTESLFDWSGDDGLLDETDPYVVLGLSESASWQEITVTHRRLAKLHHPDRLVEPTDEERERSERRIRELNVAYTELRRRRNR